MKKETVFTENRDEIKAAGLTLLMVERDCDYNKETRKQLAGKAEGKSNCWRTLRDIIWDYHVYFDGEFRAIVELRDGETKFQLIEVNRSDVILKYFCRFKKNIEDSVRAALLNNQIPTVEQIKAKAATEAEERRKFEAQWAADRVKEKARDTIIAKLIEWRKEGGESIHMGTLVTESETLGMLIDKL